MKLHRLALAASLLASLAARSSAQYEFDVIAFDHVELDFASALAVSPSWAILVNTGSVPLPMSEWNDALHASRIGAPVGALDFHTGASAGALQPGQAIGYGHPALLALLAPGETFAWGVSAILHIGEPVPLDTTQPFFASVVVGDREVRLECDVEFTQDGGPVFQSLGARRWSSGPATAGIESLPSGCAGSLVPWPGLSSEALVTAGLSSDLPVVGNHQFGVRVGGAALDLFALGFDVQPGAFALGACTLHLGLSPAFFTLPGTLNIAGYQYVNTPIPDQAALLGAKVRVQAVTFDAGGVQGVTPALELLVGAGA